MEGITSEEDMWTPFKELQSLVETAVTSKEVLIFDQFEKALQKHKQNFLTILKNPPKNAKSREDLMRGTTEGIKLHGIGHQILPKELVDEAIIISDMYDLNEYLALHLLCTAQQQMPYHPGLTRGLVAVLLYYDGRKALVTSLKILVQARLGILWTLESSDQVAEYITNYTSDLMENEIINKILRALDSLDLSKEMETLQKNRALGGTKHHHQIVTLFQGIRQGLADIVYLWAAQTGLPKQPTLALIDQLRRTKLQEDSSGGVDGVTLALQMALLYAIDLSVLQRREDSEDIAEMLPLLCESQFVPDVMKEITSGKSWECKGLEALTQLAWAITLASLRLVPPPLQPPGLYEEDDMLIDAAVDGKVFKFLNNTFLLNETIYKEEFYLRRLHHLMTDFIVLMPLKMKELRNKAEDAAKTISVYAQEGLDPPTSLSQNFEQFMLCLATLYSSDPLNINLEMDYWCPDGTTPASYPYRAPPRQVSLFKFVRQSGDVLPPTLFVPYMKMLTSLASCQGAARQAFNLLKQNNQSTASWDHFFSSLNRYYSNLRQELPPMTDTVYRHRNYPKGITPQEIQGLQSVLGVIRMVAEHDEVSRLAFCENPAWAPLTLLLGLVTCSIQIPLKAELLLTLAALAKSPDTATVLWHNLEASQILVTVPSTSSYQPRGIQTELEELESRNEEFPMTRAMLKLLDVLTDMPIPRLLGVGTRTPGFDPYLTFVLHSVLLRFNTRSYKNPQEKWEVCHSCMKLLVKFINQYEPNVEDFSGTTVHIQGGGSSQVNPPPGFHIMVNMCSKSELLRLVLLLIHDGCAALDTYTVFVGKSMLEASTLLCLQLLDSTLGLQQKFLDTCSGAKSSLLLTGLNKLLLGVNPCTRKSDHTLNIAKYVTYNSWLPSHALSAVHILLAITSHPTLPTHIVSVFTSTPALKTHIRHGFVECLEADDSEPFTDEEELSLIGKTKEGIFKLLLQCLNHTPPNLSHYLLGFDLNKDIKKTTFQQPGVLGFPRTCLHSVLAFLSASLKFRPGNPSPAMNPRLIELAYRLVYSLAANMRTSEPTLRFLRSSGDFLQKHLTALPFQTNNKASDLMQMSWLLKTISIELKMTSAHQQFSQMTGIVNILVAEREKVNTSPEFTSVFPQQIVHTFDDSGAKEFPSKRAVFQLLKILGFSVDPIAQPVWEFFEPSQIEQVIRQCEVSSGSTSLKLIDVKQLHRILVDELTAVQGSSTAGQRQLIMQEIQSVLRYAVKLNKQRRVSTATIHYLDAWRQVVEVMFSVVPSDTLPFDLRFPLLLGLIHELLSKVLENSVLTELAVLSSSAVLLLFVSLRNSYTVECNKFYLPNTDVEEQVNKLATLVSSEENVFKTVMSSILQWILSSASSQKLRVNLYASLLNFLHLSRQQSEKPPLAIRTENADSNSYVSLLDENESFLQSMWITRHSSLEVLAGFGERLITVLCHDCAGGHDICKMLALSCLDMMVELDPHCTWVSVLSSRGYIKYIIDSLLDYNSQLTDLLSPVLKTLRPLYVYESKMALLCRIASTSIGAELLLEQNCLACLSAMQVFDNHPDTTALLGGTTSMELEFIPSVNLRYLQILSPALTLCETILSSLGVENESAIVQVLHFLLSHGEMVTQVLRSGSPYVQPCYLKELAQLTGLIARSTNQNIVKKINKVGDSNMLLESSTHFHRIRKLMLALMSRFVLSESILKDITDTVDVDRSSSQTRAEIIHNFIQIAANLVLYVRNLVTSCGVDRRVTNVVLQPVLLDSLIPDRREMSINQEASLGVVIQQLVQCVNHHQREKGQLDLLVRRLDSIPEMNTTTLKEFLPEELKRISGLDECKQQAIQLMRQEIDTKKQELDTCCFIMEHCIYLLWAHLDYYMLRAIPYKVLGLEKPLGGRAGSQMGEITWSVTVEEINILKQGVVSIFNDTFCKNLITAQEQSASSKGFIEALLRRIKKLIQFVPNN